MSAQWPGLDNETLFYTRVDENHRPSKVYRHQLGTDPKDDVLVYEEKDPRFFCGVGRSRSGEYVFISAGMNDQDEMRFIPTATPDSRTSACYAPAMKGLNIVLTIRATGF